MACQNTLDRPKPDTVAPTLKNQRNSQSILECGKPWHDPAKTASISSPIWTWWRVRTYSRVSCGLPEDVSDRPRPDTSLAHSQNSTSIATSIRWTPCTHLPLRRSSSQHSSERIAWPASPRSAHRLVATPTCPRHTVSRRAFRECGTFPVGFGPFGRVPTHSRESTCPVSV